MPELPEVETVMRGLAPTLTGATIARVRLNRPDLRFPFPKGFANALAGRRITDLSRRAKYILADTSDGQVLILHLGMTGRFVIERPDGARTPGEFYYDHPRDTAHDHVVFELEGGARVIYNDPRRFGFMDLTPRATLGEHRSFKGLGIEPLGNALTGEKLLDLFEGKAANFKAALMDQRLIAGLGNIYVCEALLRAKLTPERPAGSLTPGEATRLADDIRTILGEAVALGGSTISDFVHADGASGAFQERFAVYDREGEPCDTCLTPITRVVHSNRSTFFCARCQPRGA